jgi:TP901 family phage tail tape measure protein
MSSLNPDVIQLRVLIDGSPARKELAELSQEAQQVKQAMQGLKKSSDEYAAGSAKLDAITARQAELRKEIGLSSLSLKELNAEMGRARAAYTAATPNTEQWTQAAARVAELKEARRELTDQNRIDMRIWEATRQQYQLVNMTTEQLALETKRLKAEMARPDISAVERGQLAAQLNLVKDRTEQLTNANRIAADAWDVQRKNIKLTDMTLEQLGLEADRLKAKLGTMAPGDLGLVATRRELSLVESRAKSLQSGLGPLGRAWQGVKTQVMSAGAVIGAMFAGGAIFSGIRNLITGAAKVSDELANVQKVTGLSAAAVAQLNAQISKIDTRTATSELRGIAIGLGQVGEEATAASVSAINKINLALGSEFGSDAQAITNTISVLRNNLNDIKSTDYAKDVGQIGNAILVLGQAGLATAPVVSDIATRISGVGRQFGVTSGEILGTAAAFQELGISTERGSTAYTRLITKIAQQPQAFAEIVKKAGGDVQQFLRMVDTDMQGAFLAVARAAKVAGTENTAFAKILDDLNTQGVGVGELLSKAGANAELFAKKSDLATEALKNQNAINEQARLAEENLAGQIEKLGKEWNKVATSRTVLDWLTSIVAGTRAAVAWIRNNADAIGFLLKVVANAAVAWGTYTASVILKNRWEQISAAGMRALAGVQALLSGNISRATAAFKGFTTALRENPLGILLTVVTTAVTLF